MNAHKSLAEKMRTLGGVEWISSSYLHLNVPEKSVICCDPPYSNTSKYKGAEGFDSRTFWKWCAQKHYEGHAVFVSEYEAPSDFECRLEIKKTLGLRTKNGNGVRIEKVFVHKDADYGTSSVSLLDVLDLNSHIS